MNHSVLSLLSSRLCRALGTTFFSMLISSISCSVSADDHFIDRVRISGFGSLVLTRGGDKELGFRTNVSQEGEFGNWSFRPDSTLGIQVDADFTDRLRGTFQIVGKDRPENSVENSIEAAYLNYNYDPRLTVRVGRLPLDLLPMSEFQHISYTYDWVRLPTDYYGLLAYSYLDGLDLRYSRPAGPGTISLRVYAGTTESIYESFGQHNYFDFDPFYGASLRYELNRLMLMASYARSEISYFKNTGLDLLQGALRSFPSVTGGPDIADKFDLEGMVTDYYSLAAEYRTGPWKVNAEVVYMDTEDELALPSLGGYASLSRRMGDVSVYGLVSQARTIGDSDNFTAPQLPSQLNNFVTRAVNTVHSDQKTLSLGTRWDLRNNMALKMQWDRTWIEEGEAFLWGRDTEQTPGTSVDTLALGLDFVF